MRRHIYYSQRLLIYLLLCFFLVQCTKTPSPKKPEYILFLDEIPQHIKEIKNLTIFNGETNPIYSIELISENSYGEFEEPYLGSIWGCVIDDKDRVIIFDIDMTSSSFPPRNSLHVYNADGSYHTEIGGPGRGPGEFDALSSVGVGAGKVFTLDAFNLRLNRYNTSDYSFERSTLIERWEINDIEATKGLKFRGIITRNDGNHLAMFNEQISGVGINRPEIKYLLMDEDGNALDFETRKFPSSLNVIKSNSIVPSSLMWLPFMGHTIIDLSIEDELYSVWTQDFLIKKYDSNGVYQSAIYYPVKGSPFDLNDYTKSEMYNKRDVLNTLENFSEELPETFPVIYDIIIDDENRIWVAIHMGVQSEKYEWWVLKESGELLAKLILPKDQPIYDIKNGYLYSKKVNEETSSEYVIKYKIELEKRAE